MLALLSAMWLRKVLVDSVPEAGPTMEVFLRNKNEQPTYTCPRSHPYAFNKVLKKLTTAGAFVKLVK